MAKSSKVSSSRKSVKQETPNMVSLQIYIDVIYKSKGHVTENDYVWNRAGSIVEVDERDVPYFLQKKQSGSCCGSQTEQPIFVIV